MNRFFLRSMAAAGAVAAMLTACNGGQKGAGQADDAIISNFSVVETVKSASQSFRLTAPDDSAFFEISTTLQWPERFGDNPIDSLQRLLLLTAYNFDGTDPDKAIRSFLSSTDPFDGGFTITPCDSVGLEELSPDNYEYEVKATVAELSEQGVTYVVATSSYLGGAHPNSVSTPMTYVFDAQAVLTADNMFRKGSDSTVETALREALAAQYGVTPDRLTEAGFFGNDVPLPKSVYASQGNVVFHYNPYEIAPYSSGTIDVEVPAYALLDCLTPMAKAYFQAEED